MTKQTGVPEYRDSSSLAREFPVGSRVQLHAATGDWMRGDRYGEVTGYGREREYTEAGTGAVYRQRPVMVKLDKSKKVKRFHPANLFALERSNPKARDPAHRKLLKKLDTHFAADEKDNREHLVQMQHAAYLSGDAESFAHYGKALRKKNPSRMTHWREGERVALRIPLGQGYPVALPKNSTGTITLVRDHDIAVQFDATPNIPPQYIAHEWAVLESALKRNPRAKKNPDAYVIALYSLHPESKIRMTYDANRNRFTDNSPPSLYRTQIAAKDRAELLLKQNRKLHDYRIAVEPARDAERGSVYGARVRRQNPGGRKKYGIGVRGNTLTIFKYAGTPTRETHPQFGAVIGMFATRAQMEKALLAQRRGSNTAYIVADETHPKS